MAHVEEYAPGGSGMSEGPTYADSTSHPNDWALYAYA